MNGSLKRRWPLDEAIICLQKGQKSKIADHDRVVNSRF